MTLKSRLKQKYFLNLEDLNDTPHLKKSIIESLDTEYIFDLSLTQATCLVWYLRESKPFTLENLMDMFNDEV